MRKKIFGVLTLLFFVATCFGFTACGKKSNPQFHVYYALNANSDNWLDGTNGIDCFYGAGENYLQTDANGWAKLYIKIDVTNAKTDRLVVSNRTTSNGTTFAERVVKENEVFEIDVNGVVPLNLNVLETNSQKSFSFDINVSNLLEGIQVNNSVKPAVKVGGTINLAEFKNKILTFLPVDSNNKSLTYQTNVSYKVTGFGSFDGAGNFIPAGSELTSRLYNSVDCQGTLLHVNDTYNFSLSCYAIEVEVASLDRPDLADATKKFYVYVVEDANLSPIVKYAGTDSVVNSPITLYSGADTRFSRVELAVENPYHGPYSNPVNTADGKAVYAVKLYDAQNNRPVESGALLNDQTLQLEYDAEQNEYAITLVSYKTTNSLNLKFVLELTGLDFGNGVANSGTTTITIDQKMLPTALKINEEELSNEQNSYAATIYSVKGKQQALSLNLSIVNPLNNQQGILIDSANNFVLTNDLEKPVSNGDEVKNNSTLKVLFANDLTANGEFNLRIRSNPEFFMGVAQAPTYITITVAVKQVDTADAVNIFKDSNYTTPLNATNTVDIGVGIKNSVYLRVYYTGTNFDASSVAFLINSSAVKFNNNSDRLNLSELAPTRVSGHDGEGTFNEYTLELTNVNELENFSIDIFVANKFEKSFKLSAKNLSDGNFDVNTSLSSEQNAYKVNGVENEHFNFAIVYGKTVNFTISGKDVLNRSIDVVHSIQRVAFSNEDLNNEYNCFADNAVSLTNLPNVNQEVRTSTFGVHGARANYTQVVQITVNYYALKDGYVQLLTSEPISVEFAVFVPIDDIELNIEYAKGTNALTFINAPANSDVVQKYAHATLTYKAKSGFDLYSPSTALYFSSSSGRVTYNNPNKINVELLQNVENNNINLTYNDSLGGFGNNTLTILEGKIDITLTAPASIDALEFKFRASNFGLEIGDSKFMTVRFQTSAVASGVEISGKDLVLEGNDLYYLNISYLDSDLVEKFFNANASYLNSNNNTFKLRELDFKLYKATINGNAVDDYALVDDDDSIRIEKTNNDNEYKIVANNSSNGGIYRLDVFALDSYSASEDVYRAISSIYLRVSDGTTENPFAISNATDFAKIAGKLDKNFTITNDFELENTIEGSFEGMLSGLSEIVDGNKVYYSKHTLTINLNHINALKDENFIALFQKLSNNAVVQNLNLVVKFDVNNLKSTTGKIYVGALAGINEGSINDVSVSTESVADLTFENLALDDESTLYFGLLVGKNLGNINMLSSSVTATSLSISPSKKSSYDIGLIAGLNDGSIVGEYLGKASLDSVNYTIVANLVVSNKNAPEATFNVGAVAGENAKSISQVIVGGRIVLNGQPSANSYLGGLAGQAHSGSGAEFKGFNKVATLGLDLTNNTGAVAGIVAKSDGVEIYDARIISTKVSFFAGADLNCYGKIKGANLVGGLVADANNTTIANANLENFNAGADGYFYTLESQTNQVASFVYQATECSIDLSFANINLACLETGSNQLVLTSPSSTNESGTYFLGRVQNFNYQNNQYVLNKNSNFVVVYSDDGFYYKKGESLQKFQEYSQLSGEYLLEQLTGDAGEKTKYYLVNDMYMPDGDEGEEAYVLKYKLENLFDESFEPLSPDDIISKDTIYNVKTDWQEFITTQLTAGVSWQDAVGTIENLDAEDEAYYQYAAGKNEIQSEQYFPYLVVNEEESRIVKPTEIKASFNADYVIYINSVVIDENEDDIDFDIPKYNISQILLVDYFERENATSSEEFNSHYIVNKVRNVNGVVEQSGLIDLKVANQDENDFDGGVNFEIVEGKNRAYITSDGEKIVFTAVGVEPVVVRAYSLFNQTAEKYFAFFVQHGSSKLNLNASSINLVPSVEQGIDYELSLHTGGNPVELTVGAENIFKSQKFLTMFDSDLVNFLKLSATGAENSILNLETYEKSVRVSVKDKSSFERSENEEVELAMSLDLTACYGESYFPKIDGANQTKLVGKIKLLVTAYKATQKIEANVIANEVDSESHVKFNVNLLTGYVKENDESGYVLSDTLTIDGNVVSFNEQGKDSLILTFNNNDDVALSNLLSATGVSVAELFDYTISYTYIKEGEIVKGYTYSIELSLKNELNYRYLTNNVNLTLSITSQLNPTATEKDLCAQVDLTFKPTEFKSARFYNYEVTSFNQSATEILQVNAIDTPYISPAEGFGSIMVIHLEPTYALVRNAVLSSSNENGVTLLFTQLIYNKETNSFANLPFSDSNHVSELNLQQFTSYEGEGLPYGYNGVIYVMVNVSERINASKILKATLTVNVEGQDQPIVREKQLTTKYLPGVALEYDNTAKVKDKGNEYLIQEETINRVKITMFGYELNNTPDINFVWNLERDENGNYIYDGFKYDEENGQENLAVIVDKDSKKYDINSFVRHGTLKDYRNLISNEDGSVSFDFDIYTANDIPASFKLTAGLSFAGNKSETKELIFHPVKYILKSVYVNGLNNGVLNTVINNRTRIDLTFRTNNDNADLSDEIYNNLISQFKVDNKTGVQAFAHAFSYSIENFGYGYFDDETIKQFLISYNRDHIYLTALSEVEANITLSIGYSYVRGEDGLYQVKFGLSLTSDLTLPTYSFSLVIRSGTNEFAPTRISDANEFVQKLSAGENEDFILMNDIDLYDYNPNLISANFASLDGNNKVITIHNFSVGSTAENGVAKYGLFTSIGSYTPAGEDTQKSTTLKNVIVNYGELEPLTIIKTDQISSVVFGGLVATVEAGGIVYNCDVMNLSSQQTDVNIVLNGFVGANVTFGGLVGQNNGVITNSRVGRISYDKIMLDVVTQPDESVVKVSAYPINFVLGGKSVEQNDTSTNGFIGVAGGFVGENNGTIASSYFANAGLTNYSKIPQEENLTAGFVAVNNSEGKIRYSYVKALENTIVGIEQANSTGMEIKSMGNGNVAGFVYNNLGEINDCFANTMLTTDSALIAGFVYNNQSGASIKACYAACTLNALHTENQDRFSYAEQPFVGVNERQELLSKGELVNCHYLEPGIVSYNIKEGKPNATALRKDNFRSPNNLNGFVFVNSNKRQESDLGIWSYYIVGSDEMHALPELTSANQIAYSYRYLVSEEENVFANAPSYVLGSKNNPYIIRTAEEYNRVFTGVSTNDEFDEGLHSFTGYVRLINNISFASEVQEQKNAEILTRADFTFGDKLNPDNITSFEGNGMSISDISLDIKGSSLAEENLQKVGLFGEISNAYIKNLNLSFMQFDQVSKTSPIKYSGGLAGTIENSTLINLKLDGNSTTLWGKNFVGGVAGLITGKSLLYNLEVNINVVSDSNIVSGMYYNKNDFAKVMVATDQLKQEQVNNSEILDAEYKEYVNNLSYAGGVAGVLDLSSRSDGENLSNITVDTKNMASRATGSNIEAGFAGGVAGYASAETDAFKLKVYVGTDTAIYGSQAAGGLFAVSLGKITASQVTARESETEQFAYDDAFGNYIKNLADNPDATLDLSQIGNTSLLSSQGYVGGLVGIGITTRIESSYAKSSVELAQTFGGLVGLSVGTTIFHSYAVPYVNLDNTIIEADNPIVQNIGGLIGEATSIQSNSETHKEYVTYAIACLNTQTPKYTDIAYTFSTILTDNAMLKNIINGSVVDAANGKQVNIENKNINYLVANYQTNGVCHVYSNDNPIDSTETLNVFVGRVKNYAQNEETDVFKYDHGEYFALDEIYDTEAETSAQAELFNQVFGDWPTQYWLLNEARYFPLLIKEDVGDYIEIKEAKDLDILVANPSLHYRVMNDIDIRDWKENFNTNWIFDVEFTGTLEGYLGEDEDVTALPRIYNLYVNTIEDNTSGLFRSTKKSTIKNIDFVWTPLDNANSAINVQNNKISTIGGLTCDDNGSKFNNVNVFVGQYNKVNRQIQSVPEYNLVNNSSQMPIQAFGGLVGNAKNTTMESCNFNGNVTANMANADGDVKFGGLIANGSKATDDDGAESRFDNEKFLISDSVVGGEENYRTSFNITVNTCNNAYIGNAFGWVEDAGISRVNVGNNLNDFNARKITTSIDLSSCLNTHIGGFIGYAENSSVSSCEALTNLTVSATSDNVTANIAGLVGRYGGTQAIRNSLAEVDISITEQNLTNLRVAGGVAEIFASGTINLLQNVFTGQINCSEDTNLAASNVYAAGVLAYLHGEGANAYINENFTNVAITVGGVDADEAKSGTTILYAGGIVGYAQGNIAITNCLTAGQIVPLTSNNATTIQVGGIIGSANNINITNSISTSTILLDSIASKAIAHLDVHAILGNTNEEGGEPSIALSNVYYSSDISLVPEELCENATNLSANALTHPIIDSSWVETLVSAGWASLPDGLPYIANLKTKLVNYKILINNDLNELKGYAAGSSVNPIQITATDLQTGNNIKDSYNYYILEENTLSNDIYQSSVKINGVLIASDSEYVYQSANQGSVFDSLDKHSAISNFHLRVADDSTIDLSNGNSGILVTNNAGVIFNCSVQGVGLKVQAGDGGIIAGINDGLISYCYSSAEIVELTANSFGGICYTNNGKILSCYFTGYIDNNSSAAAGITVQLSNTSYIYNCYMAGVVTNLADNALSVYSLKGLGENNYIDVNVNKKDIDEITSNDLGEISNLKTIDTQFLMANESGNKALLQGKWFTTVRKTSNNRYYVDLSASTYGFNYLYPIYNFYKHNGTMQLIVQNYALYTGTGVDDYFVNMDNDLTKNDYLNNITNLISSEEENRIYTHALKVPHLGVLKAVQGIANTVKNESEPIKTNFNYVLIYDINGQISATGGANEYYQWQAIGTTGSQENEFYNIDAEFNGLFISNKFYNFTKPNEESSNKTENLCTVQNLSKQGLFTNINNAYFGYVVFGSMYELENSGAIGVSANGGGQIYVNNLYYLNQAKFTAKDGGYVSAMFGSVDNSATKIVIQDSGFAQHSTFNIVIENANNAGFIVGYFNGGTVNFEGGNNLRIAFASSVNYAGGLVGELRSGNIYGVSSNSAVIILDADSSVQLSNLKLGGIIGHVTSGEIVQAGKNVINKISVYFSPEITVAGLGGLVYEVNNMSVIFDQCEVMLDDSTTFKPTMANFGGANCYFGLICANMVVDSSSAGGIKVYNFNCTQNITIEIVLKDNASFNSDNITNKKLGFGGLIGHTKGGTLTLSLSETLSPTIKVRSANVGGFVGCYEGGLFAFEEDLQYSAEIYGYCNVGGAMGYCSADVTSDSIAKFIDFEDAETDSLNFLNNFSFATLRSFEELTDVTTTLNFYNWGGMFGFLDNAKVADVTNNNQIIVGAIKVDENYYKQQTNPTIYNVGGVAGKVIANEIGAEFTTLGNNGSISVLEGQTGDAGKEGVYRAASLGETGFDVLELSVGSFTFDVGGNYYFAMLPINVGGIFGLSDDAILMKLNNAGEIIGYQNVGGLVGYANNTTISSESISTANVVGVVNVGGAVGTLNNNSTLTANVQANVYGNFNVGGAVGFIVNGSINGAVVGSTGTEQESNTQIVKGIYLKTLHYINIPEGSTAQSGQFNRAAIMFPTNVGGLAGSKAVESSPLTIENNTVQNVLVTSSDEGALIEYDTRDSIVKTFNTSYTISTVNNPFLYKVNENAQTTSNPQINLKNICVIPTSFSKNNEGKIKDDYLVKFDEMRTGFGGFIGSVDSRSVLDNIATNKMNGVDVHAMLGINTGAIYGSYNANYSKAYGDESQSTAHAIETPTLLSDLYVEGAYNIGGIAGNVYTQSGGVDIIAFETETSAEFVHCSANTTIHVQAHRQQSRESLVGIYVGGLFGKLEGKANDMKINGSGLKIEMTTSNSYYAGGLIGCLNGNLGEENSTINSNIVNGGNANETGKPFTINGDDKINFGGLVGMLKKTSSASEPAYVIGWQPYAFTVNTVENRNYYDGETSYDYDDQDENNLYLTAQAYYVNQDTFNISYSRGGASSVGEDVTTDNSRWFGKNSNNPLLEDTFGWAKEYTMFKIVQRNIPQSNNNGAQWDSISVVYDASKITYVATGVNATEWYGKAIDENEAKQILYSYEKAQVDTNLGLQTRAKPISLWDEYVNLYGEADALKKINEHIFFTVYEFGDNNPILYSRMGIASVMKDEKDKFITNAPASDLYVLSQNDIGGEDQPLAICGGQIYYDLAKGARKTSWTTNPDETIDISLEIDPRATNTLSYLPWYYENAVATDQNKYPSIFGWDWTWFTTSEIEVTYSYDILESLEAKNLYAKYEDEINKGSKDVYSFKTPYMIAGVNTGDQNNANIFHNWQKGSNGNEGSWSGNKKKDEALQKITYRLGERNDLSQYDITWHIAGNNNSIEMNRKANFVYKISNSVYGDVWFRFDTVFENWTTNRSDENTYTNDNLSTDGSVFNIMGLVSRDAYNKIHQKVSIPVSGDTFWEAAWRWAAGAAAAIVAALISVGVFVATGGTGAVATVAIVIGYISALTSNGLLITSLVVGLVQHFKVQNTGNVIVQMNTLENRQDLSFGLFADSYTREVKYVKNENGDWVMKVQIDSSVTYKDEHIPNQETGELPYMFYSSTRPTDYYKGYYLVAVNGAAGKSSAESLSDLFEKVPKKDVTINTDGKYEYCGNDEKFKGKDKDLTIVKTYVYENGMYYISAFASTNIYTPSQDFAYNIFNGENCKYNASQFVSDSGIYYVQGQYDSSSGKYTLPNKDLTGNLLVWDRENSNIRNEKDSGSGVGFADFESNVGVPFVTESNITFVPATDEYNTDNENNGYIYRVKDTVRNRLYLGYGYMKGVYYTANGKNVNIGSKVASFSKFSDSDSIEGLTEGVDYIVVTYNDTSHQITDQDGKVTGYQPATAYYKFSSMGTASDAKNYSNGTVQIGEYSPNGLPDNINVNLYPSAFENPYHVNNTGFTYDGNQYFINTNCLEEKNPTGISHKVQYFYYDGGYKVGSYKNQDQLDNGSGIVFTSTAVVSNYDLGLDSDNLGSITIDLYDQSGAQIFAPDNQPITLYYLAANFNSYKNYYLTNSTEAMYKVVNNYKIEGGEEIAIVRTLNGRIKEYTSKVYEIYTLNMEYVVKDGVLMNVDVQFPTANDEDFNRNKYLMNSSLQIYTRYKFTDGKIPWTTANNSNNGNQFTDFDTEHALGWVKEQATGYKYYLFKNNANPNSGSRNTTYLTENVLVTLGGGKNVKTSSLGSANTKSGSFNAK